MPALAGSLRLGYPEAEPPAEQQSTLRMGADGEELVTTLKLNEQDRSSSQRQWSTPRPPVGSSSKQGSPPVSQSGSKRGSRSCSLRRSRSKESTLEELPSEGITPLKVSPTGKSSSRSNSLRRSNSKEAGYSSSRRSNSKDLKSDGYGSSAALPEAPSVPPLEWTRKPVRVVERVGNSIHQVSTPQPGPREHKTHLVRTTRIEPISPDTSGKPPVPGRKREQIVVTEKDLQRCGGDLKKLRECAIATPESREQEATTRPKQLELSFKSAFDQMCREGHDERDPWESVENPEENKKMSEQDLVLNQVWFKALSPKKLEREEDDDVQAVKPGSPAAQAAKPGSPDGSSPPQTRRSASASTRASSADPSAAYVAEERRISSRRSSSRPLPPPLGGSTAAVAATALATAAARAKRNISRGRGNSKRASSQAPASEQAQPQQRTMRFASPIKPLVDDEDELPKTPAALRDERKFVEHAKKCGEVRSVWLCVDSQTGEVEVYDRNVGARLESAFLSGRNSVPMAGFGGEFEGAIVMLADSHSKRRSRLRHMNGTEHEVCRAEVTAYSYSMSVRLVGPGHGSMDWRFAGEGEEAIERNLQLFGTELVAPPSPTLPPVSSNRQPVHFINACADWGHEW
eukprot:TRINITY_DN5260_c0_g1_i1.p1 TRINITY_DN5260_c0_g1~~TRINITY_DN5260_c0_g1_i1.p1  ORF type:complete len:653 (+),score=119.78 TRINITY_DN5260_c0_g1_i1:70-1959(+)